MTLAKPRNNNNCPLFLFKVNVSIYLGLILYFLTQCLPANAQKIPELSKFKVQQHLIDAADSLPNDRVDESIALYEQANKLFKLDDFAMYTFAMMYGMKKNSSKAYEWLYKIGMSKFLFCDKDTSEYCILNDILSDTAFSFMHNDDDWKKFIDIKHRQINKSYSKLNIGVVNELKEMYLNDQKYRLYIVNNMAKLYEPAHKKERDSLFRRQDIIDSLNFNRFKELTKKYGWLGYKKFGRYSEILVTHINKDFDFFLPLMIKAARKGDLEWIHVDACMTRRMTCLLLTKEGVSLDDIYFSPNSSILLRSSEYQLNNLVHNFALLKPYLKSISITLDYKDNLDLSKARMEAVIEYLKKQNIDTKIISINIKQNEGLKQDFELKIRVIKKQ